jgi:drug/metabolite transporter (DMT)-like permease
MPRQALLLTLYTSGYAFVTIAVRFLTHHFDVFTINGYRLLAGAVVLLLTAIIRHRGELVSTLSDWGRLRGIALVALSWVLSMLFLVEGARRTSAVVVSLVLALGVPLAIAATVLAYPDERELARRPGFILGSVLALGGTVGLALYGADLTPEFSVGIVYLVIARLVMAGSSVVTKRVADTVEPFCASGLTSALASALFFVGAAFSGGLSAPLEATAVANAVLFGSGVYGLLVGGLLLFTVVREAGMVTTRVAELGIPVFTGLLGYLLFDETLTGAQLAFAALLLAGCLLVALQQRRRAI